MKNHKRGAVGVVEVVLLLAVLAAGAFVLSGIYSTTREGADGSAMVLLTDEQRTYSDLKGEEDGKVSFIVPQGWQLADAEYDGKTLTRVFTTEDFTRLFPPAGSYISRGAEIRVSATKGPRVSVAERIKALKAEPVYILTDTVREGSAGGEAGVRYDGGHYTTSDCVEVSADNGFNYSFCYEWQQVPDNAIGFNGHGEPRLSESALVAKRALHKQAFEDLLASVKFED